MDEDFERLQMVKMDAIIKDMASEINALQREIMFLTKKVYCLERIHEKEVSKYECLIHKS
jgi:hypothetical protein